MRTLPIPHDLPSHSDERRNASNQAFPLDHCPLRGCQFAINPDQFDAAKRDQAKQQPRCAAACSPPNEGTYYEVPIRRFDFVVVRYLAILATILILPATFAEAAQPPTLQTIRASREAGEFKSAAEQLITLDSQSESDLSVEFAITAQAYKRENADYDASIVDELYSRAAASLNESTTTPASLDQRCLIRSIAASHFMERKKSDLAFVVVSDAFQELKSDTAKPSPQRANQLANLALNIGWAELSSERPENAMELYAFLNTHLEHSPWKDCLKDRRPQILLGLGWAQSMVPSQQKQAAVTLGKFVENYPQHPDAAQASMTAIRCLDQSNQTEQAQKHRAEYLRRWPKTAEANEIASQMIQTCTNTQHPDFATSEYKSLKTWIVSRGDPDSWSAKLAGQAIEFAGPALPPQRFDTLLRLLTSNDETGQLTAELLHNTSRESDATDTRGSITKSTPAIAEQVATILISGDLTQAEPMSREAACRWAGRKGKWTMLALAASNSKPQDQASNRTAHVDRLFAEALMQTGQSHRAADWWAHLVDNREARDFPTLLRCAETAIAHNDIATATERIQLARDAIAAGETDFRPVRESLLNLLAAELAIRKIDFSAARTMLESVVRSAASTPELRGRAQWLIGESYFMQRQFRDSIECYRKVEGLNPGGAYVPAALVQAGKAFEQLGLTREAGDCYSGLLGRFADSSYADEARKRMAALPSSTSSGTNSSPGANSPLRR